MTKDALSLLQRQLVVPWKLTQYHLEGLTTAECLWRPAARGLHVWPDRAGRWLADWPEHENYDLGPASIAWLTWHLGFWWSMVLDHTFGPGTLRREDVYWPGQAEAVRAWLANLHDRWAAQLASLTDADLQAATLTRWPYQERPFGDVVAWVNIELMKNAAEIGYARYLHAVTTP